MEKPSYVMAVQFLASWLGIKQAELEILLDSLGPNFYKKIRIPKKSGGFRFCHEPNEELKKAQELLLAFFYEHNFYSSAWPSDDFLFAFKRGVSVKENAEVHIFGYEHKRKRVPAWIVKLDLKDAFPSVKNETLARMFKEIFHESVCDAHSFKEGGRDCSLEVLEYFSEIVAKLATLSGFLPQGSPTSPYLFNLVLVWSGIVREINRLCQGRYTFSVYADDIIISSAKNPLSSGFVKEAISAIESAGCFKINREKVKVNFLKYKAHLITGISVSRSRNGSIVFTLPQKKLKKWRGIIHRAGKILESGRLPTKETDGFNVNQAKGYIQWIRNVLGERLNSFVRQPIHEFEKRLTEFNNQHN